MTKSTFLVLAAFLTVSEVTMAQNHFNEYISDDQAEVYVNGVRMTDQDVDAMEDHYGTAIPDGSYWYDPMSGALIQVEAAGRTAGGAYTGAQMSASADPELSTADQIALYLMVGAALNADTWQGSYDYGDVGYQAWYGDQSGGGWDGGEYGSVYSEVGDTRSTVASDGSGGYMFMSSDGTSWYSGQ